MRSVRAWLRAQDVTALVRNERLGARSSEFPRYSQQSGYPQQSGYSQPGAQPYSGDYPGSGRAPRGVLLAGSSHVPGECLAALLAMYLRLPLSDLS